MKILAVIAVCSWCSGCVTAIHERANPAGGPPLVSILASSNAERIQFHSASGAVFVVHALDNSTGPKEAIRVWSIFDLGRTATDTIGALVGSLIDKAGEGQ